MNFLVPSINILPKKLQSDPTLQKSYRLISVDMTSEYAFVESVKPAKGTYILIATCVISGYPTMQATSKVIVS